MLEIQQKTDMRRASLISEIYSENAGPTGGNMQQRRTSQPQKPANNGGGEQKPGQTGQGGQAGQDEKKKGLEQAGISKDLMKNHPMFRPKRVTKSGLSKLSKTMIQNCVYVAWINRHTYLCNT